MFQRHERRVHGVFNTPEKPTSSSTPRPKSSASAAARRLTLKDDEDCEDRETNSSSKEDEETSTVKAKVLDELLFKSTSDEGDLFSDLPSPSSVAPPPPLIPPQSSVVVATPVDTNHSSESTSSRSSSAGNGATKYISTSSVRWPVNVQTTPHHLPAPPPPPQSPSHHHHGVSGLAFSQLASPLHSPPFCASPATIFPGNATATSSSSSASPVAPHHPPNFSHPSFSNSHHHSAPSPVPNPVTSIAQVNNCEYVISVNWRKWGEK